MEEMSLMEYLLGETEEKPEFQIDNDRKADWAVEKVMEAIAERDRLVAIADQRIRELQEQKVAISAKADRSTQYLTEKLYAYFLTVSPSSVTKTQTSYKLLTGKLVLKKQQPEYVRDEQAMLAWAKANSPSLVRVEEKINWGDLKKVTALDGETVVLADTGEVIPGVTAVARPDVFEVKHE